MCIRKVSNIILTIVIVDFQAKLGIEYPDFDKPDALDMVRLSFRLNKKETTKNDVQKHKRNWWKFW